MLGQECSQAQDVPPRAEGSPAPGTLPTSSCPITAMPAPPAPLALAPSPLLRPPGRLPSGPPERAPPMAPLVHTAATFGRVRTPFSGRELRPGSVGLSVSMSSRGEVRTVLPGRVCFGKLPRLTSSGGRRPPVSGWRKRVFGSTSVVRLLTRDPAGKFDFPLCTHTLSPLSHVHAWRTQAPQRAWVLVTGLSGHVANHCKRRRRHLQNRDSDGDTPPGQS